jgi:hypothetical protein
MRKKLLYFMLISLASCQHELHFPVVPVVIHPPEKLVTAIVVTNPAQTDYDSMVFRYSADIIREVHYDPHKDSVTRTYYYDAAGRLSKLEDETAIYYTNKDMARRISFQYDANGQLQKTITDFTGASGINAYCNTSSAASEKKMIFIDTAYVGTAYNLEWNNRIIYSTLNNSNQLLYDSGVFINPANSSLFKTIVNEYAYAADSSVTSINKRIYFNGQLTEYGTVYATSGKTAPLFQALHRKLYRNLSNWFDTGLAWQDDRFHIFPLAAGPYASILYTGYSTVNGNTPYTRNYEYDNSYSGDQLDKCSINYSLLGQGTSKYTTVLRFYYNQ